MILFNKHKKVHVGTFVHIRVNHQIKNLSIKGMKTSSAQTRLSKTPKNELKTQHMKKNDKNYMSRTSCN